jgi:hypothetical protein
MKTTIKLVLAVSLFGSIALADGNQGNGGSPMAQPGTVRTPSVAVRVVLGVVRQYLGLGF